MVATMGDNDRAPVVELEFSKTPTVSRASCIMKPSPMKEKKPPAWRLYTSNCIALDRLVEVALSPTGVLDSSFRNNARTPENQVVPSKFYPKTPKSADSRDGSRDDEGEDGESAQKRRHCCSNGIKLAKPAAAPSPSPSPSSEAPNHQSAGYFQRQQQQQKLKRRLSSFNEISTPAGRSSSSSLRVHVEHPHAKRFKLTPRFKALVDISC